MKSAIFAVVTLLRTATLIGPWTLLDSGTSANFRGVSAAGPGVAWVSGSGGTVLRTTDGGASWQRRIVPGADALDFRDIQAFDDRTAFLLSIGAGELSRIYKTVDGGATWTPQHVNRDPKGFLDALAFWDAEHGLALGDPVDGRFAILTTDDGGKTWSSPPSAGMPEALPGEGAFAASGTCLVVEGTSNAWFGTGGGASSRIFRSTDRGRTWEVATTPIRSGNPSTGVFSIAFLDSRTGVAVGGDYKAEGDPLGNVARTEDGGRTWSTIQGTRPAGFRSAVAVFPGREGKRLAAVGPTGSDVSPDSRADLATARAAGVPCPEHRRRGRLGRRGERTDRPARPGPARMSVPVQKSNWSMLSFVNENGLPSRTLSPSSFTVPSRPAAKPGSPARSFPSTTARAASTER